MYTSSGIDVIITLTKLYVQCRIDATASMEKLREVRSGANVCPASHPRFLYPLGDGYGGLLMKQVFVPRTVSAYYYIYFFWIIFHN